jgi:hypothetical protein
MEVFAGLAILAIVGAFGALIYGLFFEKERHFDERNFDEDKGLSKEDLLPLGSGVPPLSSHAVDKGLPHFVSTAGTASSRSEQSDGGLDTGDIILGAVIANQLLSSPPEPSPEPELEHTEEPMWTHHEHLDSEPEPSSYSSDSSSSSSDYSSSDSSSSYDSGSSDSGSSDSGGD